MKLTVFRYKIWDHQDDDHVHIAPYYAVREYIEHLEGATVIEDDYLEVDESDLDPHGRIAVRDDDWGTKRLLKDAYPWIVRDFYIPFVHVTLS